MNSMISVLLILSMAIAAVLSHGHGHGGFGHGHGGFGLGHGGHGGHGHGGHGGHGGYGHGGHGGYGGYGHDFKVNYKISHGDYHSHQDRYKSHNPYGFQYGVYQSHPYGGKSTIQHYQNTGHGHH